MPLFTVLLPEEVRRKYERAENKAATVRLLAELTASTLSEMECFLGLKEPPVSKYAARNQPGRPPASLDENLAKQLYEQGCSDAAIASRMDISSSSVYRWRRRNGLPPACQPRDFEERRMALYQAGATDLEIAAAEGRTQKAISSWRTKRRLPANTKPKEA